MFISISMISLYSLQWKKQLIYEVVPFSTISGRNNKSVDEIRQKIY